MSPNNIPTQTIYFDADDHDADGNGWNIVDGGSVALRFPTFAEATGWCDRNGIAYESVEAACDCGAVYTVASRFDHDADTGQCWRCSDRSPDEMTVDEWASYIVG